METMRDSPLVRFRWRGRAVPAWGGIVFAASGLHRGESRWLSASVARGRGPHEQFCVRLSPWVHESRVVAIDFPSAAAATVPATVSGNPKVIIATEVLE